MPVTIEIGEPPVGRWNYLQPRAAEIAPEAITVRHPVASFQAIVRKSLPCFVRKPRGLDVYAACGQLKRMEENAVVTLVGS